MPGKLSWKYLGTARISLDFTSRYRLTFTSEILLCFKLIILIERTWISPGKFVFARARAQNSPSAGYWQNPTRYMKLCALKYKAKTQIILLNNHSLKWFRGKTNRTRKWSSISKPLQYNTTSLLPMVRFYRIQLSSIDVDKHRYPQCWYTSADSPVTIQQPTNPHLNSLWHF